MIRLRVTYKSGSVAFTSAKAAELRMFSMWSFMELNNIESMEIVSYDKED